MFRHPEAHHTSAVQPEPSARKPDYSLSLSAANAVASFVGEILAKTCLD